MTWLASLWLCVQCGLEAILRWFMPSGFETHAWQTWDCQPRQGSRTRGFQNAINFPVAIVRLVGTRCRVRQRMDVGGGNVHVVLWRRLSIGLSQARTPTRHLYSQHGVGCQLLHANAFSLVCVSYRRAVNYLPPPLVPNIVLARREQDRSSILESSNEAATMA